MHFSFAALSTNAPITVDVNPVQNKFLPTHYQEGDVSSSSNQTMLLDCPQFYTSPTASSPPYN
jgi:hypothetical protein